MLQCRPAQEFSFGPRALKDALVSTDTALRQLYATALSPTERLFLAEAYDPQAALFCPLRIHAASDWLLSRPEPPEDFQTFYQALQHQRPSQGRKHIYLQPIDLSEDLVGWPLLDRMRSYAEAFFLGLRVKCLPPLTAVSVHCSSRPRRDLDQLQFYTDDLLSFLKCHKPDDALCVLGLTLSDLYPQDSWSFTFSKSLPGHDVGVCSFARFSGEFLLPKPGGSDPDPVEVTADDPEAPVLERSWAQGFSLLGVIQCCKVMCHELCHLLGLGSCRWLGCVMQGALSVDEAVRRPPDLCPICLRKLQYLLGFRLLDRYKELHVWTQALAGTGPSWEAAECSGSEDTLPLSADSGLGGENDSEALTSVSDPLTPDVGAPELEPGEGMSPPVDLGGQPEEAVQEQMLWLVTCIQALERDVSEEELAQLDGTVDAMPRWELFTGQHPTPQQAPPSTQDSVGLRKALGNTLSSWRRKLGSLRLAKAEVLSRHWRQEKD
ncbi:PREDICTED: archaemetzincin-1-like [Elephantulus edwardii]|uniref:archaemetzincin-1-like n=1 Tax=Elephantulus edwardii TaxID=28737 RepID=UPI0003F0AA57|nr:PREDICTED: archaemetzincin-1-like [Elephantulus edwardii]